MSNPVYPPYNQTSPRQLNRWSDVNSQNGPLTRPRGCIAFPTFDIYLPWAGYSDIVGVYNYQAPNNFSFSNYKTFISSVNLSFTLCVAYTNSDASVVRYRLVTGTGENIYGYIPAYTGQLIKKNFRFEIWSVNGGGAHCIQAATFVMETSVLSRTLDRRYSDDYILVSPDTTPCQLVGGNVNLPVALPITGLKLNFASGIGIVLGAGTQVASWTDGITGKVLAQATAGLRPNVVVTGGLPSTYIRVLGQQGLATTGVVGSNIVEFFILIRRNITALNGHPVLTASGYGLNLNAGNGVDNRNLSATFDTVNYISAVADLSDYCIINAYTPEARVRTYDALYTSKMDDKVAAGGSITADPVSLGLGNALLADGKGFDVFTILGYQTQVSLADRNNVLNYLYSLISQPAFSLPLTYTSCMIQTRN